MSATQLLYNLLVLISACLSLGLAYYTTLRDPRAASRLFAALMLAVAEWSFAELFANLASNPGIRIFWLAAAYVGIAFAGPLWLLFALANTGRLELLPRSVPASILLLGLLSLAAVLGNGALALASYGAAVTAASIGALHGPLFWAHALIAYSTILAGIAVCVRTLLRARSSYRDQARLMLLGALLPLVVNVVYLSRVLDARASLDLTPVALCGTSLAFAYAVRRHRMLTISPIARQVVIDSMRDGLIVVDRAGMVVEHNPAAASIAGIDQAATGRPLASAVGNRALAAVLDDMLTDIGRVGERTVSCGDDESLRVQICQSPLADARGAHLGTLFMLRDVSEQARAEQVLARQAADLTTLHHVASAVGSTLDVPDLLRAIVSTTRAALGMSHATVGLIDAQRGELTITAESDDMGGASALGKTISLCGSFGEHWRTGAPIAIEDVRADARLVPLHELLARRGTRALLVVPLRANDRLIGTLNLASAAPYRFEREELALAQMMAGYIAAALANAQLFEASQQAVRAKSAILDTVSHEFRTPITAILGFSELYQDRVLGPVTEDQQEALEAVHRNALRLLKLVDDLLDLARLESGQLAMSLYPVDVGMSIQEATGLIAAQLRQKQLSLHVDVADSLPMVEADATWLRRVLVNLLTNAIRFTSAGGITVRAYTEDEPRTNDESTRGAQSVSSSSTVGSSSLVVIEVEDTGTGISELDQQTIFEAFRRADDTRYIFPVGSGPGLGLAISKRAIDQMNGHIAVRSRLKQGSIFTIALRPAELVLEHPPT